MKYLNSILIALMLLTSIAKGKDTDAPSNLKNFEGIWQFIPPSYSNDTTFLAFDLINGSKILTTIYRKKNQSVHSLGPNLIGFAPKDNEIQKLSDLVNVGQRMYFYRPNPNALNDSIKYFQQASPSCFASYNGLGTDWINPPVKGEPNFFIFNFNGRDYERHVQIDHLPNYVIVALANKNEELAKVEKLLNKKYAIIENIKTKIFFTPNQPSKMYLIKGDAIEIVTKKGNWLKINYYPEQNGIWTGKTIEGWIKQSDVR